MNPARRKQPQVNIDRDAQKVHRNGAAARRRRIEWDYLQYHDSHVHYLSLTPKEYLRRMNINWLLNLNRLETPTLVAITATAAIGIWNPLGWNGLQAVLGLGVILFGTVLLVRVLGWICQTIRKSIRRIRVAKPYAELSREQQAFLAEVYQEGRRCVDVHSHTHSERWIEELIEWNYLYLPYVIRAESETICMTREGWEVVKAIVED